MRPDRQHEVVRDASLTLAYILKNQLPPQLEKKQVVEVIFEHPDADQIKKAKAEKKILVAVVFISIGRSTLQHSSEQPIVREEDESGNIVEFKLGIPSFIMASYLLVPYTGDSLQDQVVLGLIMRTFFGRSTFLPEDIQGTSIDSEVTPRVDLLSSFNEEKQMQLWRAWGQPYRVGVAYGVSLRIDSMQKTFVRRVKERVLDFKKIEG